MMRIYRPNGRSRRDYKVQHTCWQRLPINCISGVRHGLLVGPGAENVDDAICLNEDFQQNAPSSRYEFIEEKFVPFNDHATCNILLRGKMQNGD